MTRCSRIALHLVAAATIGPAPACGSRRGTVHPDESRVQQHPRANAPDGSIDPFSGGEHPAKPGDLTASELRARELVVAATRSSADPVEALELWARALQQVEDPASTTAARAFVWSNAAMRLVESFERSPDASPGASRDPSHLVVAHECLVRLAALGHLPGVSASTELERLWSAHGAALEAAGVRRTPPSRHALLYLLDDEPRGAVVTVDGRRLGVTPCIVPVPIDGKEHVIDVRHTRQSTERRWTVRAGEPAE